MRYALPLLILLMAGTTQAADAPKPNSLTPKEIADGWILLFDGATSFGWKTDGEAKVEGGEVLLGGSKESTIRTTSAFGDFQLRFEFIYEGDEVLRLLWGRHKHGIRDSRTPPAWTEVEYTIESKGNQTEVQLEGITPRT